MELQISGWCDIFSAQQAVLGRCCGFGIACGKDAGAIANMVLLQPDELSDRSIINNPERNQAQLAAQLMCHGKRPASTQSPLSDCITKVQIGRILLP